MQWSWVLVLAACGRVGFDPAGESGVVERKIRFAPRGVELSDVVVGLELPARARPDAADVHIVDASRDLLELEIERWRPTEQRLAVWVRIPVLAAELPTDIFLRYGGAPTPYEPTGVWDGHVNHVWHFGQAVPPYHGSSPLAIDGVVLTSNARPSSAPGILGDGLSFDGVDDSVRFGDPADDSLDFGLGSFSFSAWVNVNSSVGPFDVLFWKGGSSLVNPGYDFELGTSAWEFRVVDGAVTISPEFGQNSSLVGNWHLLTAVIDRAAGVARSYTDGTLTSEVTLGALGSVSSDNIAVLGRADFPFAGLVDEVRVYPRAVSGAEIAFTYDVIAAPMQAYSISDELPAD